MLCFKDALEQPCGVRLFPVALTAADDSFLAAEQLHIGVILREVLHVVHGGVHVHQLVHIVAKAVVSSVDAAECQTAAEDIRAAQIQVYRVGGAQTAPEGDDAGQVAPAVALLRQMLKHRSDLAGDVAQPLLIAADAPVGVALCVRPCFLIHGVDGKHHDLPGLDPRGKGVGHVEVFKIEESAVLTGDIQHRAACVAVKLALHIPAQFRAVLLEILHLHGVSSFGVVMVLGHPFFYSSTSYSRVWNTKGSCFSQLASQWVPPGTMRLVRWMPRVISLPLRAENCRRMPSWLPISREP